MACTCYIFDRLLSITKHLSDALKSTKMNLAKATDLALATVETLEDFRSDCSWDHLFDCVETVATVGALIMSNSASKCNISNH